MQKKKKNSNYFVAMIILLCSRGFIMKKYLHPPNIANKIFLLFCSNAQMIVPNLMIAIDQLKQWHACNNR